MLDRILRAWLAAVFLLLPEIHLAPAGIIPNPEMSPTPTIPPIIEGFPTPSPTPTHPPISPPPSPTLPPVSPTPVGTPTIPPINPTALKKADAQVARAVIRYGQNGTLNLLNDRGRFQKVALQPGESKHVEFTLRSDELAFWNADMKFAVEPARLTVWIAPNSSEGEGAQIDIQP